jgi:ABC-type transport system involved in cytochrome c biogenesis permease subunit
MISTLHICNLILPLFYWATVGIYLYDFFNDSSFSSNSKRVLLFHTLLFHVFYLILRTIAFDHPPITNVFEIFTVLAFAVSFAYFILELETDIRGTGLFIIIISVIFQTISSIFIQDETVVKEVLRSNLLGSHVLSALLGYSGITISAVYGFLYLILYKEIKLNKFGLIFERMPSLEKLEQLSFYAAIIGFILLSVAIIIGIIWLPRAFKDYSYLDPKLIGTALVWLLYGIGLASKILGGWHGKRVVIFSIIGFLLAIASTLVTNFLAKSFHSFY